MINCQNSLLGGCATTNSIVNMLMKQRNQMAQASHIVSSKPRDKKDKNVALNATNAAVKNILTRNPRLPKELVQ